METVLFLFFIVISFCSFAQIRLPGYKCKFYNGQWPYTMAEMYNSKDTFRLTLYSRDIGEEMPGDAWDENKVLPLGLKICFGDNHYYRTKDSLYYSTGRNDANIYYYKVYIPNQQASVSLRSAKNDAAFSQKSQWLLAEIREHRYQDIYIINEKNQTCQNPGDPKH